MDDQRFDRWVRTRAGTASRRRIVAGVLGLAATTLGRTVAAQSETTRPVGEGQFCGGIAGIPCPDGYVCVDDPSDACDPTSGGADCGGVCRPWDVPPCGLILCTANSRCCPTCDGAGHCVPLDRSCPVFRCGEPCGTTTCDAGEYCCNESCSICSPLGGGCPEMYCGDPCGAGVVCAIDQQCCPGCPGAAGFCGDRDNPCPRPACPPPTGERCGDRACGPREACCRDCLGGRFCSRPGGPCPLLACPDHQGESCGPVFCPLGDVCCNASCGICSPPGGVCAAIACA